jgi:hypothetical protein
VNIVRCVTLAITMVMASSADAGHTRIQTEHGTVHVWSPQSYDRETAGIIIYVHGYYTDVDRAWKRHKLSRQFAESGINALFIACEAPRGPRDAVKWTSIDELLGVVAAGLDEALPDARTAAVAHSGGHRTVSMWLDDGRIDTVVLIDAFYGDMPQLREWLASNDEHQLIDVARGTRRWTERLHAELPETLVFDKFPRAAAGRLRGARSARVVYVRSQHDHMELVTGGVALPMLLRAVRLPVVENASRRAPIRRLDSTAH